MVSETTTDDIQFNIIDSISPQIDQDTLKTHKKHVRANSQNGRVK